MFYSNKRILKTSQLGIKCGKQRGRVTERQTEADWGWPQVSTGFGQTRGFLLAHERTKNPGSVVVCTYDVDSVARSRNYFPASTWKKFSQFWKKGAKEKITSAPFLQYLAKIQPQILPPNFFFSGLEWAFWPEFWPPGKTSCCPATQPSLPLPPLPLTPPIPSSPPTNCSISQILKTIIAYCSRDNYFTLCTLRADLFMW